MADIRFSNHGSIWTARPLTEAAHDWIDANISGDAVWLGGALALEPRSATHIVEGMRADGLTVEG